MSKEALLSPERHAMIPVKDLLSRIRWDNEFGNRSFEIGYLDHVLQRIIRVPFRDLHFQEGNHFSFRLEDNLGEEMVIPFHRIREIYRDGSLIWQRPVD
ncbi:MAG: DUF504 domain-containing protein [Syntrophobacteraceae bacterium]